MEVTMQELEKDVQSNKQAISALLENNTKIWKFLFGNGDKVGLDETTRNTEKAVDALSKSFEAYKLEQKEKEDRQKEKKDKIQLLVIGALISNGLTLIVTLFMWAVRIYPIIQHLEEHLP